MKRTILMSAALLFISMPAQAWNQTGNVYCDADGDRELSEGDTPLEGVLVVTYSDGLMWMDSVLTDASGGYFLGLADVPGMFETMLDAGTLPADAEVIVPAGGVGEYTTTDEFFEPVVNFLVDSSVCRSEPPGACWMTGGGVKFPGDQARGAGGPMHSFGGVVYPSCDSHPSEGGQWNHVAHRLGLHFQGNSVHTVHCGNVPGIAPGSESPVTPFNYIEFQGDGVLQGIRGNRLEPVAVSFFARVEDRNEPGSHGSAAHADRYFLHVWDETGATRLLVEDSMVPADPTTITGGNLQLHSSSCEADKTLAELSEASSRDAPYAAGSAAQGCSAAAPSKSALLWCALVLMALGLRARRRED